MTDYVWRIKFQDGMYKRVLASNIESAVKQALLFSQDRKNKESSGPATSAQCDPVSVKRKSPIETPPEKRKP